MTYNDPWKQRKREHRLIEHFQTSINRRSYFNNMSLICHLELKVKDCIMWDSICLTFALNIMQSYSILSYNVPN